MPKAQDLDDLSPQELKALWDKGLIELEDIPEYRAWIDMNRKCDPDWVNPYSKPKVQRRQ